MRFLVALATLLPALAAAVPLAPEKVPEPLRPWTEWALHGHEEARCPFPNGGADGMQPFCSWASRLDLALDAKSGRFSQGWRAFAPVWVPLPGDAVRWPLDVKVDGAPAPTVPRGEQPGVYLSPGEHSVSGTFAWNALPESLPVPPETGLLTLAIGGRAVPFPSRDASGLLWVQREAGPEAEEARLDLTVHRLVADEVPLLVTTRVRLDVSGQSREVVLAKPLLAGFEPLSIQPQLPARLDPDGRLRVQVRPGSWLIDIVGRHVGPADSLALAAPEGTWAEQEVWVFDARPELRVVNVDGVPAVDPQQTTLPDDWKDFPAYRVLPGETMRFALQRRGDADPAPDRLALSRTLWLDFDGGGWTMRDVMTGTLSESWRLTMAGPTVLGRVSVDARDQLVTREGANGPAGVEIRQSVVNLVADSRIEGPVRTLPAVGWAHDFHSVSGALQLPPGWRILHASGVDDVPSTWIRRWTLLDLFLVLVLAVAFGRIFGPIWGGLAMVALALSFPEAEAPRWVWLFPLAAEALVRVLREGRFARVLVATRVVAWIVLAIVMVPFAVHHVRLGLYPTLERPYGTIGEGEQYADASIEQTVFAAPPEAELLPRSSPAALSGATAAQEGRMGGHLERKVAKVKRALSLDDIASSNAGSAAYQQRLDLVQNDPRASVQTGPGLPEWAWQRVQLGWSGPVEKTQEVRFFLVPPAVNLVLAFVRVALLAALLVQLVRRARPPKAAIPEAPPAAAAVGVLLAILAPALAPSVAHAEPVPSAEVLAELRSRLLEKPDCHPNCVSSPRLLVEVTGATLRLRQEIGAAEATAVPLPGGLEHWSPERVVVDGQPAKAMRREGDGTLWLAIGAGLHQVVLEGPLPARDSVQLALPLKPHRVEAKADGWTVDGVRETGAADDTLQLTRVRREGEERGRQLEPGAVPPFVRVERALLLGLDWTIETRVTRLTPPGTPILLEVPLVEGESVISPDVRAENGRAQVNMGPRVAELSWKSVLARKDLLRLKAPESAAWTEVWRLEATPVWHVERSGIPSVHQEPQLGARIPEWRPWPGEEVTLRITAPEAMPGQTLTLQSSTLEVTPGLRATDGTATLVLSSSRGGQHTVTLPAAAQLQSISIDGRSQPIRQDGARVTFPVKPGRQAVVLAWREPAGLSSFYRTPAFDVGLAGVNARVHVNVSPDRWVLVVGGPHVGPAVLFWSLFVVLLAVAIALARLPLTPLRTHHWVLLALGLTQVPVAAAAFVATWLLALGWREKRGAELRSNTAFDLLQLALVGATLLALGILFASIRQGLLGHPDMQVEGNGSSAQALRWFQDRSGPALPGAFVLSVPRMVYRGLMLGWAMWLALALVGWLRWAFGALVAGGGWRPLSSPKPPRPPVRAPVPATAPATPPAPPPLPKP